MKTVDMKMPKTKKGGLGVPEAATISQRDEYPYGLRITLNEDQIKKLEHVMDYKPDTEVEIMASAKVLSVRSNDLAGGKKDRSVELQITGLACEGEGDMDKMSDEEYGKARKARKLR